VWSRPRGPWQALGRLGKEQRYVSSIAVGRVAAVARQPQRFYQVHVLPPSASAHGLPVFKADGSFLGLTAPDPQAEGWDAGEEDGAGPLAGQHGPSRIVPAAALDGLLEQARKARREAKDQGAPAGAGPDLERPAAQPDAEK